MQKLGSCNATPFCYTLTSGQFGSLSRKVRAMATKKKSTTKVRATTKKSGASFMRLVAQTEKKIHELIMKKKNANAKSGVRQFFTDNGTKKLVHAVAVAIHSEVMNPELSKFAQVEFCQKNGIPSVMRNEVTRKATNYRADNAVRARLISWNENGIIPNGVTVVWASDARVAETAWKNGDTDSHEKVFIVRTK